MHEAFADFNARRACLPCKRSHRLSSRPVVACRQHCGHL